MVTAASNSPQLTPENLRELESARFALRKIRRAVSAARFEGYTIAICGGLSLLGGIGSISISDMFVGTVLLVIGIIEIIGAGKLRSLDPKAAKMLVLNQLILAGLILLYALWNLTAEATHPTSDLPDLSPSEAQAVSQYSSPLSGLTHEIMLLLYASLILAAIVEAGMAAYYHSRGEQLRKYLETTPAWIVDMQKAGVSI
jgi:uncharacterized membrane protein HdeD (DUF308 family)